MNTKRKPRFLRRDWSKKSKLGRKRKNKQVWRRPKGRHAMMRRREAGYSKRVCIGYGASRKEKWLIEGKSPLIINNISELIKSKGAKDKILILIGGIGNLKKAEIAKKAIELGINLSNLNPKSFLERIEREKQEKIAKRQKEQKKETKEKEQKTEQKKEIKEETIETKEQQKETIENKGTREQKAIHEKKGEILKPQKNKQQ